MTALEEVFELIDDFKDDMKKLGVQVQDSVEATPVGFTSEVEIILRTLVREDLENPEDEG